MLAVLGGMAAFATLASEMPRLMAWPIACAALTHAAWQCRREARRAPVHIVFLPGFLPDRGTQATVDGMPVSGITVHWRGPLAFLRWRDARGRSQRRAFWPDTLPPARRRELRLAAPHATTAGTPASMAP